MNRDQAWLHKFLGLSAASLGFVIARFALIPLRIKLLTHFLTEEEYGSLTILVTTISCVALVFSLGSLEYLMLRTPGLPPHAQERNYKTVVVYFTRLYTGIALLAAMLFTVWQPGKLRLDAADYLLACGLFLATTLLLQRMYYLLGKQSFLKARGTHLLYADLWILPLVVGFWLGDLDVRLVLWIWVGWLILALVLTHRWVNDSGHSIIRPNRSDLRKVLSFGLPLAPIILGEWMFLLQDRYVLLHLKDAGAVGIYFLCLNITLVGFLVGISFLDILSTQFFRQRNSTGTGDHREELTAHFGLKKTYTAMLRFNLIVCIPLIFILCGLGRHLVMLLSNERFLTAADLFPYTAPIPVLMLLNYQNARVLMALGKIRFLGGITLLCALFNLGLDFVLIPSYGETGAALATVISMAVLAIFLAWSVRLPRWILKEELRPKRLILFAIWCGLGILLTPRVLPGGDLLPVLACIAWCGTGLLIFRLATLADIHLVTFFSHHSATLDVESNPP